MSHREINIAGELAAFDEHRAATALDWISPHFTNEDKQACYKAYAPGVAAMRATARGACRQSASYEDRRGQRPCCRLHRCSDERILSLAGLPSESVTRSPQCAISRLGPFARRYVAVCV